MQIEKFHGQKIERNEEGFFWNHRVYFDTIEECREDILDWEASWAEHGPFPCDTPSLPDPWWVNK